MWLENGGEHLTKKKKSSLKCHKRAKNKKETTIKIRDVHQKEIKKYLKISGKEVLSSAGCFQIEFLGPHIVENIKGDFFNVMGFPLFPFLAFLKEYNQ